MGVPLLFGEGGEEETALFRLRKAEGIHSSPAGAGLRVSSMSQTLPILLTHGRCVKP